MVTSLASLPVTKTVASFCHVTPTRTQIMSPCLRGNHLELVFLCLHMPSDPALSSAAQPSCLLNTVH